MSDGAAGNGIESATGRRPNRFSGSTTASATPSGGTRDSVHWKAVNWCTPFGGHDEQLNWPSGFVRMPDGTIYVSECRSARIRVISPDRKSFRFITSPAMKHAATIAVVAAEASHARHDLDHRVELDPQ